MKIIAVDDERIALEGLLDVICEAAPEAELTGFEYPEDALEFVEEHECTADADFLCIYYRWVPLRILHAKNP